MIVFCYSLVIRELQIKHCTMEASGSGKSASATLSFRYNANNEKLEELFNPCEDDPPTPQFDPPSTTPSENASPKRGDKTPSILDKYFKSMRTEKVPEKEKENEKSEETVTPEPKATDKEEPRSSSAPKEITCSPMKEYLNRLGKRNTIETKEAIVPETKEVNETWKIFHDFRYKIAQAVEDMKTKSVEDTKDKTVPRENSTSDSEENSIVKDDQPSVGDTDNQVSSLDSSMQNLSEVTQPVTAKATEKELSVSLDVKNSESSDDTHKNLGPNDLVEDYLNDSLMDVESGVEALEDTMDIFGDHTNIPPAFHSDKPVDITPSQPPPLLTNFGIPPSQTNLKESSTNQQKVYILNLTIYILTCVLVVSYMLFPESDSWNGFVFGIWFVFLACNVRDWVYENYLKDRDTQVLQLKRSSAMPAMYTIPSVKEHTPIKKFEGWINHYRFPEYDPYTYHVNKSTTAFMKLEGCNLRISYTMTKIAKRALWDEKIEKVSFYQHRLYNLTGAKVMLLPEGLVKRRLWSKKYPICVILSDNEKIQVLEKESALQEKRISEMLSDKLKKEQMSQEHESTETNTSPEKKKKFVWRRREKSVHIEGEPGREGLRHRLVRKMHRDKRTDSVSTCTEPPSDAQGQTSEKTSQIDDPPPADDEIATKTSVSKEEVEEELDDTEMSKIKEFLEETEQDTGPDGPLYGEWSVHVKDSKDRNSHLFLFGRTGREKQEWYRRLIQAITEAQSADSSTADEKSAPVESKDGIEVSAMKSENDTVAFNKNANKTSESMSEGVTFHPSLSQAFLADKEHCEKNFWPYLLKIIQNHEKNFRQSAEIGVMCQIEPSPRDKSKHKKRKSRDSKTPPPGCECRMLPSEVTWLNTVLARVMFDVMRDPKLIARVQRRIQMKLHTLKLPSFMSPLIVTELSLAGACPLIERVLPPAWDARGVWLDADLRYEGGAYIALLTQINLMKLKEKNLTLEDQLLATSDNIVETDMRSSPVSDDLLKKRKPAVYDSEMEDSAESSSDDETPPVQPVDSDVALPTPEPVSSVPGEGGSSKKKFLRMVDKIATNKYFQQVTDYKYVKRAMEGLSNTDIKLHLEVHGLEGRLALNLPPPPHDRLWIGFRTNPQLVLKARPAVGARTLRFAHISNWIEQKLSKEFEKILVLPNMEDILIDVMTPTPVRSGD